jgi:hypothetical protein
MKIKNLPALLLACAFGSFSFIVMPVTPDSKRRSVSGKIHFSVPPFPLSSIKENSPKKYVYAYFFATGSKCKKSQRNKEADSEITLFYSGIFGTSTEKYLDKNTDWEKQYLDKVKKYNIDNNLECKEFTSVSVIYQDTREIAYKEIKKMVSEFENEANGAYSVDFIPNY